jgi:hypothetical protein
MGKDERSNYYKVEEIGEIGKNQFQKRENRGSAQKIDFLRRASEIKIKYGSPVKLVNRF